MELEVCIHCLDNFKLVGRPHTEFSVPGKVYLNRAWALFEFDEASQKLIHHLKYSRRRKSIGALMDYYSDQIVGLLPAESVDYIVSIPLHPRKLRERGYNQVDDMSDWLSPRLGCNLGNHLVKRTKYTSSQTKLNVDERAENVSDAFDTVDDSAVLGKHFLLVDDVLTTGATANSLAKILLKTGAKRVDLITLATPQFGNA